MNAHYAIIDIETTGIGQPGDRIIEIAIFLHNGKSIIDEYVTLINPEKRIPLNITHLTGIDDQMVKSAPKFFEIARKIVEMTQDAVFVAHNANFDYGFICREFRMLEYNYRRPTLCTVKLSKKLVPGLPSYSLGNICKSLNINIKDRHRAAGDALATVKLFEYLLSLQESIDNEIFTNINQNFDRNIIKTLPSATGVYYFYDENKELIYIGKSKNIHDRVVSHFSNQKTNKAVEMKSKIADISYYITGSELVSLLMESDEIKKHKPLYNRAQRRTGSNWGIFSYTDKGGYLCFKIANSDSKTTPIICFSSQQEAKNLLEKTTENFNLCQKLTGLYNNHGACFHYSINQCKGACLGHEHPMLYNQRALQAINALGFDNTNMLIIDQGRNDSEKAIVCIEKGKYLGFGYFPNDIQIKSISEVKEYLNGNAGNKDISLIIKSFLKKNKVEKILKY